MRTAAWCVMLVGAAALFAGCAAKRPQPAPVTRSSPELASRFQAAAAISDPATRDQALARVAWLGAQTGDGYAVLKCLGAMTDPSARDKAAYQCSGRLAEDGWVPQASAAARMITDPTVRDRALSKIAQSSVYPVAPQ